jgi:hypothetical protein
MRHTIRTLLPVAALCVALAGCASKSGPGLAGAAAEPAEDRRAFVTKDDFLTLVAGGVPAEMRNTIEVRHYRAGANIYTDLHEVELEVFNLLEDQPIDFEVRTLFFRKDGTILDVTEWATATAPPRRGYHYRSMAFSPYATSEQVQLRLLEAGGKAR